MRKQFRKNKKDQNMFRSTGLNKKSKNLTINMPRGGIRL